MERVITLLEDVNKKLLFTNKFGLSVKEASVYSGIGEKKIEELCKTGEIAFKQVTPCKKIITKKALEDYLES